MSDDTNTAIHTLIKNWLKAACNSDLEGVMALYTENVRAFDALGVLQYKGADDYRKHWSNCMSYVQPGWKMVMEAHEMEITHSGDLAVAHYISRCGCVDGEGNEQLGWMRATVCCRKTPAGWRIFHEHYSSPFDPQTLKVTENLAP